MPDFRSLRSRIALVLLLLAATVWVLGVLTTVWITRQESEEMLDGQLAQAVRFIAALPTEEFEEVEHELSKISMPVSHYEPYFAFLVWNRKGELVFSSANAPAIPMPAASALSQVRTEVIDGREWRIHTVENNRVGHIVQALAVNRLDAGFVLHVATQFARTTVWIVPLVLLLGALALRQALSPIERLRAKVAARDTRATTPLSIADVPSEISGLVEAINGLSLRHEQVLTNVRHFTADAAHELRTPIASMRMHAQVAKAEADAAWRNAALDELEQVARKASAVLDQLFSLAHLDHAEIDFRQDPSDLAALLQRCTEGNNRVLLKVPPEPVVVRCMPQLLELALRNLLSNAEKFAGDGQILVELSRRSDPDRVEIAVEDDGPGIPAAHIESVFEPFFRLPESTAEGTGLGLSIVQRVMQAHGGTAAVQAPRTLHGARVVMSFPEKSA